MILTVTLNPALDKTVRVADFGAGRLNRAASVRVDAGGKGINVARAVRGLGGACTAMGFLPGRGGAWIGDQLAGFGIGADFVSTPGEARTNLKIADRNNGTVTELNEAGPEAPPSAYADLEARLLARVARGDVVVLSGSIPPGGDPDLYRRWIAALKARGADTVLDADGELLRRGATAGPGAVKPNIHELEIFAGKPLADAVEIASTAGRFLAYGTDSVLVSLGPKGAVWVGGEIVLRAAAVEVDLVTTVGAGDAMVAALAMARQRGDAPADALRLAVACAAASCMTNGGECLSPGLVRELQPRVRIEPVG